MRSFSLTLNADGAEATIAEVGVLRLFARCSINEDGLDFIRVIATSSEDDWYHFAGISTAGLLAGVEHIVLSTGAATTTTRVTRQIDRGGVLGPNGEWIAIQGETTMLGLNVYENVCYVAGVVSTRRNTLN